jgi:energy-converting hydrogenase Eha subunit F
MSKKPIILAVVGLLFLGVLIMNLSTYEPGPSYEQTQLDEQQACIDIGGVPVVIPNETVLQGYKLICTHEQTEVRKDK